MMKRTLIAFQLSLCSIFLILPTTAWSKAKRPVESAPLLTSDQGVWIKDGASSPFAIKIVHAESYVSAAVIASKSDAQLRYEAVSGEACLSKKNGDLCLDWNRSIIESKSHHFKKRMSLLMVNNDLYVPLKFVASPEFQKWSDTRISWSASDKILNQDTPTTISLPYVENFGNKYQLTIEVKNISQFQLLEQNEKRIWMRFLGGRAENSQVLEGDSVIQQVKIVQHQNSADMLVMLGSNALSSSVLHDADGKKILVNIPVKGGGPVIKKEVEKPVKVSSQAAPITPVAVKSTPRIMPTPVEDKKIRTIIVDAGHGGMDCGAIGVRGTYEKEINLRVAKALAKFLSKEKNVRVILTRDKDEFVSLQDRTTMANKAQADLFVSIHCNSSLSVESTGLEVYILSPSATDEAAAAVARIENSVSTLESKKGETDSKLSELLASMAVHNFINESSKVAAYILKGVKEKASVKKSSVQEANFHVLRGAQMPGVLVELDYLSNPVTEIKLRSSRYGEQLAKGILEGVLSYEKVAQSKQSLAPNQAVKFAEKDKK